MISQIDSADDPRLAPYARVGDAAWLRLQHLFVAEGRLVVERVIAAGRFAIESIVVTAPAWRALADRLDGLDTPILVCSPETVHRVTGFDFHRGCLALVRRPEPVAGETFALPQSPGHDDEAAASRILLALEGVANPDNVGGLFRTAAAFGVAGILISPGTADPLYRKSVRTSMGAVLEVPWTVGEPWPLALDPLRSLGYRLAALTPHPEAMPIARFAECGHPRVVLLLGAEGSGLSDATLDLADDRVRIPILASADSLNVTVAAGIAIHALQSRAGASSLNREH